MLCKYEYLGMLWLSQTAEGERLFDSISNLRNRASGNATAVWVLGRCYCTVGNDHGIAYYASA